MRLTCFVMLAFIIQLLVSISKRIIDYKPNILSQRDLNLQRHLGVSIKPKTHLSHPTSASRVKAHQRDEDKQQGCGDGETWGQEGLSPKGRTSQRERNLWKKLHRDE